MKPSKIFYNNCTSIARCYKPIFEFILDAAIGFPLMLLTYQIYDPYYIEFFIKATLITFALAAISCFVLSTMLFLHLALKTTWDIASYRFNNTINQSIVESAKEFLEKNNGAIENDLREKFNKLCQTYNISYKKAQLGAPYCNIDHEELTEKDEISIIINNNVPHFYKSSTLNKWLQTSETDPVSRRKISEITIHDYKEKDCVPELVAIAKQILKIKAESEAKIKADSTMHLIPQYQ